MRALRRAVESALKGVEQDKLDDIMQLIVAQKRILMTIINVSNIFAEVEWKEIKNIHLTIYPPNARVHVSAPIGMTEEAVRLFLITKMPWINQRITQILGQNRQTPREYVSGENHYFKGQRYRLKVLYHNAPAKVEIQGNEYIKLYVRDGHLQSVERRCYENGIDLNLNRYLLL